MGQSRSRGCRPWFHILPKLEVAVNLESSRKITNSSSACRIEIGYVPLLDGGHSSGPNAAQSTQPADDSSVDARLT